MARDRNRSRELRRVAEYLASEIPEEALTATRAEIATSLLRQWLTYDGHATLFFATEQHFLTPDVEPGRNPRFGFFKVDAGGWYRSLMEEWDFGPEELRAAIRQLNVGQSAQIENRRGEFLRVWANPKERTKGSERLGGPPRAEPAPAGPDYHKFANRALLGVFTAKLPETDLADLTAALVRQWAENDNHAVLVTGAKNHQIVVVPESEGLYRVSIRVTHSDLGDRLVACGVHPDHLYRVLHQINLGERPVFADEWGQAYVVVTDPRSAAAGLVPAFLAPPA